jgi:hypothetical protein
LSQFFLNKGLWTLQIIKDLEMVECKAALDWLNGALQVLPTEQLPQDPERLAALLDVTQESEAIRDHWHNLDGIWFRSLEGEPAAAVGRYFIKHKEMFQ